MGKFCEPQASGIQSPGGAPYNSPAVEPRKGRNPGNRPQKVNANPGRGGIKRGSEYGIVSKCRKHQKHAPTPARSSRLRVSLRSLATPWPAASLRSSPLYVTTGSLGSIQISYPNRGSAASPLHPCLTSVAPLPRGFEFRSHTARKRPFNFRFIAPFAIT